MNSRCMLLVGSPDHDPNDTTVDWIEEIHVNATENGAFLNVSYKVYPETSLYFENTLNRLSDEGGRAKGYTCKPPPAATPSETRYS